MLQSNGENICIDNISDNFVKWHSQVKLLDFFSPNVWKELGGGGGGGVSLFSSITHENW